MLIHFIKWMVNVGKNHNVGLLSDLRLIHTSIQISDKGQFSGLEDLSSILMDYEPPKHVMKRMLNQ